MSIIKEKLKYVGNSMNLKFNLSSDDSFLGYQQEIDNLTQIVSLDLVNPEIDIEERRFYSKNLTSPASQIEFQFFNTTFQNNFLAAGFTPTEITGRSSNVLNSFFILDYYDTYDINTQTKIFTTYLTKIGNIPKYTINAANQLYYWYIPIWYLITQTGSTVNGYIKLSFYNAIDGKIAIFYNNANVALTTSEKMFFMAELNIPNKTWRFMTPNILAKQLTTSPQYNQRVNDTVANYNNESQNYPSGSTFSQITGRYIII